METGQLNGVPTVAIDGTGRTFVFARNSEGKLVHTYSIGSGWSAWTYVSYWQQDVMEGIAAITRDDGVVELFATGRSGQLQRFYQSGTSPSFIDNTVAFPFQAASSPTVTKNADGRLEIFFREISVPGDGTKYGRVLTAWVNSSGQWVGGSPSYPGSVLYGDAGLGPVAAMRRGGTGHIMLFERSWDGRVSATWQLSPNSSFSTQWAVLGGPGPAQMIIEYASATTDGAGRALVIAKGSDGKLYIDRESSAASVGSFSGWLQVGS
jgi:hypothetical protein